MGQKNIDDDLMYEKSKKKNDMAEKHFIVTERLRRRQQKIARFECIQLFFSLWGTV